MCKLLSVLLPLEPFPSFLFMFSNQAAESTINLIPLVVNKYSNIPQNAFNSNCCGVGKSLSAFFPPILQKKIIFLVVANHHHIPAHIL